MFVDYGKCINRLFESKSEEIFEIHDSEEESIVLVNMFTKAKKRIIILCKNLDHNIFTREDVITSVEEFLRKDNTILYIGYQDDIINSDGLLDHLINLPKEIRSKVVFYKSRMFINNNKSFTFTTMDDVGYIYRPDYNKYYAVSSANNLIFTTKLYTTFTETFGLKS